MSVKLKRVKHFICLLTVVVFVACSGDEDPPNSGSDYYYRIGKEGETFQWLLSVKNKQTNFVMPYFTWNFPANPLYYDDLSELENYVDSLSKEIIILSFIPEPPLSITDFEFISEYQYYKVHKLTLEEEIVKTEQIIKFE